MRNIITILLLLFFTVSQSQSIPARFYMKPGTDSIYQIVVYNGDTTRVFGFVIPRPWGLITGSLPNQTDLNNALSGKQPTGSYLVAADISGKANLISPSFTTPNIGAATGTSFVATGNITSSGGGIGYVTGNGGTVTQATSKSTAVTLNKLAGDITTNAASLAAAAIVSFTLTNSTITATDIIHVQHNATGTFGAYTITGRSAAGSAVISIRNNTAGALAEAIVIKYIVLKSSTN